MPPTLTVTRDGANPIQHIPADFTLTPASFGAPADLTGRLRLSAADGWSVEPSGALTWRVRPWRVALDRPALFALEAGDLRWTLDLHVALELTSTFDPTQHALPLANSVDDLGEYAPRPVAFWATYRRLPMPLARALFAGLYHDIVFMRSGDGPRGGLCSGMARWAIARGRGDEPNPSTVAAAIERIGVYHGRQLCDRALLSALPWFVRGSPRAAYRAVRRDLLGRGQSDRALDIGVPKLWRRDLASALVREGHTVVPHQLRQPDAATAQLAVYDPNHLESLGTDTPRAIDFDLRANRYRYGSLVAPEQRNVGMIAVHQSAYAQRGSALLACLGSLLLAPTRACSALLRVPAHEKARA